MFCISKVSCWVGVGSLLLCLATAAQDLQTLKLSSRVVSRNSFAYRTRNLKRAPDLSEPLLEYFNGTDLQWYGNVSFGTPGQTFTVVFDTGSWEAEIAGASCRECANQKRFDPSASSTFVDLHQSTVLQFATGKSALVWILDFENLTVSAANDTFTIMDFSAPNVTFHLITSQTSGFAADPFSGIVGMGYYPNYSVYHILNEHNKPALFSLYLTPESVGNAELTLGGIDESKFSGDIRYSPIVGPDMIPNFWSLDSSLISVNGKTSSVLDGHHRIVFDSGTSNCVFPKTIAEAINTLISPKITPHGTLGAYGMPCADINNTAAELDFTFTDVSGQAFNLTIPSQELNLGPFHDDPQTCQIIINALEGYSIVGGSLLKHYYSVWDVDHAQLGFATNGISNGANKSDGNTTSDGAKTRNDCAYMRPDHWLLTFAVVGSLFLRAT